jgi:hypothetical protein
MFCKSHLICYTFCDWFNIYTNNIQTNEIAYNIDKKILKNRRVVVDRPKSLPFKISRYSFENFIALDKFRVWKNINFPLFLYVTLSPVSNAL